MLKIIRILFMSTIQIRNKMDDEIHENNFYFMANAQLFDSSESTEIGIADVKHGCQHRGFFLHIFIQIIGHAN